MAIQITPKNATEESIFEFSAEASSLGLKPGEWPAKIDTTLGNGLPFMRLRPITTNGELNGVRYGQVAGCIEIVIWND